MKEQQPQRCLTISVEAAGQRLGISRNAAYEAARRGDLPIVRMGKRMLVPIAAFNAMLDPAPRNTKVA